jgi:RNA polymerase sigma factor (sigma-70 family)
MTAAVTRRGVLGAGGVLALALCPGARAMPGRDRFDGDFDAVLASARAGEARGIERIFVALSPVVEGYLRLQGSAEPEDLTSEVFVALVRNIGSFAGDEAGFRSWVFTIAHRRLLDERRRATRRPPPTALDAAYHHRAGDDVERSALDALATEQVRALCERLGPNQRDVLLLRLIGRLTVEEVADVLDKSPGAVKALQRRGFRAVARLIEREGVPL